MLRISEFIELLEDCKKNNGDIFILKEDNEFGPEPIAIDSLQVGKYGPMENIGLKADEYVVIE